jgi:putative membrane protein
VRLPFLSSALTMLVLTSAIAQSTDRPRNPPPRNPGFATPGTNEESTGAMPAPHQANSADQVFILAASRAGHAGIRLARLAEESADSESVREFARQMIRGYTRTNDVLNRLTEEGGVPAPDRPDPERRQIHDALSKLSGPEFDIEYLRTQVQAHQRMAQLLEYEIGSGSDAEAQRFASDALPNVFIHLAKAQQLLDRVSTRNLQIAAAPPRKVSGMPRPQTPRANSD